MSACDKCNYDHHCHDCSQIQILRGLRGRDAMKYFGMWAFDDKINKEALFIAHNDSNYDSHFILSYLVEKTEYPEILDNGGKILQMYIKTCESKFIESYCFLSMSLSKFSNTFNLPEIVKRTSPHCFKTPNNYEYFGRPPALHYYEPNGLQEPARSQLIQWHVALLKSGCIKFRVCFWLTLELMLFAIVRFPVLRLWADAYYESGHNKWVNVHGTVA